MRNPPAIKEPCCALWIRLVASLLVMVPMLLGAGCTAMAAETGAWTLSGNGGSATVGGVAVTISGVQGGAATAGTMNATNFWSDPYGGTVAGTTDITVLPIDAGGTGGANTQTVTITFNKAVTNPVFHIDRVGGSFNGAVNTSIWTLSSSTSTGGSVSFSKLSGNNAFAVTANSFQRATVGAPAAGGNAECLSATTDDGNAACGSFQAVGSGITSLTFMVTFANPSGQGDALEIKVGLPDTKLIYKKQSVGGMAAFTFTGTNGVAGSTLNTATTNPATSSTSTLTDNTANTTITETTVPGYQLTGTSCADQTSAAITSSLAGQVLTVPASSIASVSGQTITCTFTNTKTPTLTLTKISNGGTGSFTFTGTNGWSSQTITTSSPGTGVAGATQTLAAASTATTLTEAAPAGWLMISVSCTGTGDGTQPSVNLSAGTISFTAAQLAAGTTVACTVTNSAAVFRVKVITQTTTGGPFSFAQTNLASTPASITTVSAGVAAPASPSANNVTMVGTAVTLTETPASGFVLTAASCADANSAATGNSGSIGSLSGNLLTVAAANVKAGSDYTCTFTNAVINTSLSITKTYSASPVPVSVGQAITYTYVITNTGNVPMNNVQVKDMHGSPPAQVPVGGSGITTETLTSAGPQGAAASPDTTPNDGIWTTLAPGATVTMTYVHTVTQAEIDKG